MARANETELQIRELFDVAMADRSGRPERFHVVVDKMKRAYGKDVLAQAARTAPRERAEEVAQETWAAVYRDLGTFRREGAFHAWLMRITSNKAVDVLRKVNGKRYQALSDAFDKLLAPSSDSPSRKLARAERDRLLHEFIAELDNEDQDIVELHYVKGQLAADIARERNIPPNTVAQRIRRIRQRLKKICIEAGISRP